MKDKNRHFIFVDKRAIKIVLIKNVKGATKKFGLL